MDGPQERPSPHRRGPPTVTPTLKARYRPTVRFFVADRSGSGVGRDTPHWNLWITRLSTGAPAAELRGPTIGPAQATTWSVPQKDQRERRCEVTASVAG